MTALADAHIVAQERIRRRTAAAVGSAWRSLSAYDRENVPEFLQLAVPIVAAGQRQSAATTNAFLARATRRSPLALNVAAVTGAGVRAGTPPETVYERPFVTVWTALKAGTEFKDAVNAGRARATGSAAMDVQLTMRATLRDIGERDDMILGFERVPDGDACEFCVLVAGQQYTTQDLMPVHNHCGCGVDVITAENRGDFSGSTDNDLSMPSSVSIAEHGELGPLLVSGDHHFTQL